ncbi:MAG: hypothetical protein ACKVRN_14880 [Pyrinomonadaceae bacterium]
MDKEQISKETFKNAIDRDGENADDSQGEGEDYRGEYKYDPIAHWYYPAPYPSEMGHGSGV